MKLNKIFEKSDKDMKYLSSGLFVDNSYIYTRIKSFSKMFINFYNLDCMLIIDFSFYKHTNNINNIEYEEYR